MLGHYVLDKNRQSDNLRIFLEATLAYFEETLSGEWSPEMEATMSKLFLTTVLDAGTAKIAYLDTVYKC